MTVLTREVDASYGRSDAWSQDAACVEALDPSAFDPGASGFAQQVALAWCDECPVRQQCFAAASATRDLPQQLRAWGTWGGRVFANGKPID